MGRMMSVMRKTMTSAANKSNNNNNKMIKSDDNNVDNNKVMFSLSKLFLGRIKSPTLLRETLIITMIVVGVVISLTKYVKLTQNLQHYRANTTTSKQGYDDGMVPEYKSSTLSALTAIVSKTKNISLPTFNGNNTNVQTASNNNNVTNNKPYFILHVGPPKTATTSIQCGLDQYSDILANQDGYFYLGRSCTKQKHEKLPLKNGLYPMNPLEFEHALKKKRRKYLINFHNETFTDTTATKKHIETFEDIRDIFLYHHAQGHHLIFSSELISSKANSRIGQIQTWNKLLKGFENSKIVISYRHYFDWYKSYYYQIHQHSAYINKWPTNGGKTHVTFQEFLKQHLERWELHIKNNNTIPENRFDTHLSLWMYYEWSKHFNNVEVFEFDQSGDIFTDFVCHMLPTANITCQYLIDILKEEQFSENQTVTKRVSSDRKIHAQRIVEAAFEHGMINDTTTIRKNRLAHNIEDIIEELQLDTNPGYLLCLSTTFEDQFHNASLSFLKNLYSSIHSEKVLNNEAWIERQKQHNLQFNSSKSKYKFCDIDIDKVFENKSFLTRAMEAINNAQKEPTETV